MQNASYQSVRTSALSGYAEKAAHLSRLTKLCSDSLKLHYQGHIHSDPVYIELLEVFRQLEQISLELSELPTIKPWQYLLPFMKREG